MQRLIDRIAAAFPAGLPAPERIVVHQCGECARVERDFAGKNWQALSADVIQYHADSLPLLSPEAFAFYLPAYLSFAAADPSGLVGELLIYSLAPSPLARRTACAYDLEQRRLVIEVAALIAGDEEHFRGFLRSATASWLDD